MLKRRNSSGVSSCAKAFFALNALLRSPMLALPLHSRTFGRVMISIWVRPASWLSAANELVRKRIWRISSRDGSRPPRNPLTWKVAPEPPVICRSASASSSGSSGSESISSCSSVVVCELPLRSSVTARSLTTTSSCKPAMPSVTFWLFAPRLRFTVASWAVKPGNSTCSCTAPGASPGTVARPRSSDITVIDAPVVGVTTIVALGMPAPVSSTTTRRSCA